MISQNKIYDTLRKVIELNYLYEKTRTQYERKKRSVPLYIHDTYVFTILRTVHQLYDELIFELAKEYRFYCEEMNEQYKNNSFVKMNCEMVKLEIRYMMNILRQLINIAKENIKNVKVKYCDLTSKLAEVEHIIEEFMREPSSLSKVMSEIEKRKKELEADLRRIEYAFDILVDFMEYYGWIYIKDTRSGRMYICTKCGYRTMSKPDIVSHVLLHVKAEHDKIRAKEESEILGEEEQEE